MWQQDLPGAPYQSGGSRLGPGYLELPNSSNRLTFGEILGAKTTDLIREDLSSLLLKRDTCCTMSEHDTCCIPTRSDDIE